MTEADMLELRVIRALLFVCISLAYMAPVVAAMRVLRRDPVTLLTNVVDSARGDSALAKVLGSLTTMARDEWFATEEDVQRHLLRPEVRRGLLDAPPTKLNFWLAAALILNPAAADELFASVKKLLIADGVTSEMAGDLVRLSRATDVLSLALRGEALPEREVEIGAETAALLAAAGWLGGNASRRVQLRMAPERLAAVQAWLAERQPLSVFDITQVLGEFTALYLRPLKPKKQAAA
jgi:hypothetical protein